MATQYLDGTFSETKPLDVALEDFTHAAEAGFAKAFHVGTPKQIEAVKNELSIMEEISGLKQRIQDIEAENSKIIDSPTLAEIERFAGS